MFEFKPVPFFSGACKAFKIKEILNMNKTQNLEKRDYEHHLNKIIL